MQTTWQRHVANLARVIEKFSEQLTEAKNRCMKGVGYLCPEVHYVHIPTSGSTLRLEGIIRRGELEVYTTSGIYAHPMVICETTS